ncbi:hypothetical protein O6H91_07G120800 [Diphasiastrum complanatum]|uniref:Uncharacterized protein n=2 Tax=Diphasiastrum complanatum TaxID=34168 RepID=A0ACC2D9N6_DIPCM|nr:hypothetical protein O6H91_07G120800 [Diphasiastrum complanatum]KAJ7550835.1 hypothetical protein O6H91_07G120800 [Diphasiastrum complanatum]
MAAATIPKATLLAAAAGNSHSSLLLLPLRHNCNFSFPTRSLGLSSVLLLGFPRRIQGTCQAATLSKEEKVSLLDGVDKSHADIVSRVLEQARTAADRRKVFHTDFLAPPVLNDALSVIKRLANITAVVSGGHAQAERCRLSVGHVEDIGSKCKGAPKEGFPGAVAALSVSGNFAFDPAEHGDFLGAVLGTGLAREKVGDIIVLGEKGAQILVVPDLVDYLVTSLRQVRNVPVDCTTIPLSTLQYLPPRKEIFNTVEASLRVDALASAGFRLSRSKLVDLISSKDVKINWKEISKGGVTLKVGDVVSIRGKGRIEVGSIFTTRKGRFSIELIRYV